MVHCQSTRSFIRNSDDLAIASSGYTTRTVSNLMAAANSDSLDLQELFLMPIDLNQNRIADAWEAQYFGAALPVDPDADADGDGQSNRSEYIAGTDPVLAQQRLIVEETSIDSDTLELRWNTEPDRSYRVSGTTHLMSNNWVQVAGPWEASAQQVEMSWAETNMNLSWCSSYRVDVISCALIETNHILIRTNDWPVSSGGSGSFTNGIPMP